MTTPPQTPVPPTVAELRQAARRDELPALSLVAAALAAAWLLSHLGFAWDIMWHQDVGPDTFFTAPHLMVYTGGALTGLIALGAVLITTWRHRTTGVTDRSTVAVLRGAFRAPLGVVVVGWGAMTFLLAGLYDQVWHAVYGFDAVLDSPPHIALGLADVIIGGGLLVLFTLLLTRTAEGAQARWLRPLALAGFVAVSALVASGTSSYQASLLEITVAGVPLSTLFVASWSAFLLVLAAGVTRIPGTATLVAVSYSLLYAADWYFAIWATDAYADALGLFPRDDAAGIPLLTAILPMFLLAAAVVVDAGLALGRHLGTDARTAAAACGAASSVVLIVAEPLRPVLPEIYAVADSPVVVATVIVSAALGAAGGRLGWAAALRLRRMPGTAHALAHRDPR